MTKRIHTLTLAAISALALVSAGCASDFVRSSQSPSQLVIVSLNVGRGIAAGAPTTFVSGPLLSDVPNVANAETVFDDFGQVTMRVQLRDQNGPTPTALNDVTMTRYRVEYRRSDGRNTPGVDVPHSFDGALGATVSSGNTIMIFELVRHVAKLEAPLAALSNGSTVLTTIATVTFFGRDQAGNEVSVTGNVQINFAAFA